jgi:hypothetical protein
LEQRSKSLLNSIETSFKTSEKFTTKITKIDSIPKNKYQFEEQSEFTPESSYFNENIAETDSINYDCFEGSSASIESISFDDDVVKLLNSKEGQNILTEVNSDFGDVYLSANADTEKIGTLFSENRNIDRYGDVSTKLLEKLHDVSYFSIAFHSVELTDSRLNFSAVWVEYTFPGFIGQQPQGRFRTKIIQQPKSRNGKSELSIILKHSINIPIKFNKKTIHEWSNNKSGFAEFKVIGILSQKQNILPSRSSKLSNNASGLWSAIGRIQCVDLFVANKFNWSGDIALFTTYNMVSNNQTDIEGGISITISLCPDMQIPNMTPIQLVSNAREHQPNYKSPPYLYFHLGKSRALSIPNISFSNSKSILLYLRAKLFSSNSIETPPISYIHRSLDVNDEMDFNFGHTAPLALTDEFINKYGRSPIIIEVHTLISLNDSNQQKLLGLIRLPFDQIISAMISTKSEIYNLHNLQIPDTEYVIIDPFTGQSRGWIHGFLSVGTFEQIKALRESFQALENIPNIVLHDALPKEEHKKKDIAIKSINESKSTIFVTIHRACGLLGLLKQFISRSEDDMITVLNLAKESGVNSYVQLDLFPPDIEDLTTIETPAVVCSFTPLFDYQADIIFTGLNTRTIIWMQRGGYAEGKIFHHIPSDISPNNHSQSCLLGSFLIPLDILLKTGNGVYRQWFPIYSLKSDEECHAAIEISLKFEDEDLKELDLIDNLGSSSSTILNIFVHLRNATFDSNGFNKGTDLYVKWKILDHDVMDWQIAHFNELSLKTPNCFISNTKYIENIELTIADPILKLIANRGVIEFQAFIKSQYEKSDSYIGSIFIDMSQLFTATKSFHRSRSSSIQPTVMCTKQFINPSSKDLHNSSIEIEIKMEFKQSLRPNSPKKSLNTFPNHAISQDQPLHIHHLSKSPQSLVETIDIHVEVNKAMSLPLVIDPFKSKMVSPFAKPSLINNSPPNTFVTFPSCILRSSFSGSRVFQSEIVSTNIAPSWNFKELIKVPRTLKCLKELKAESKIVFSVWNSIDYSGEKIRDDVLDYQLGIGSNSNQLLGAATVHVAPLFAGLYEIHGWYPILNRNGEQRGQLMVRLRPSEHLGFILRRLSGNLSNSAFNESMKETNDDIFKIVSLPGSHKGLESDDFNPVRSISEAMHELDLLNSKMIEQLAATEAVKFSVNSVEPTTSQQILKDDHVLTEYILPEIEISEPIEPPFNLEELLPSPVKIIDSNQVRKEEELHMYELYPRESHISQQNFENKRQVLFIFTL